MANKKWHVNDLSGSGSKEHERRSLGVMERATMSLAEIDDPNYVMDRIDYEISTLVRDNSDIRKCYSYYNKERNLDDFAYLTDNYGLGHAEELRMIPIVSERVDILIGILLSQSLEFDTTVADGESFKAKEREKVTHLTNTLLHTVLSDKEKIKAIVNPEAMKAAYGEDIKDFTGIELIKKLADDIRNSYTDNFQMASQNLIKYATKSHTVQFKEKRKEFLKNLIISGLSVFENKPTKLNTHPLQKPKDSRNIFLSNNKGETHVQKHDSIVVVEEMTKHDVISEYGKYMTKTEIIELLERGSTSGYSDRVHDGVDISNEYRNEAYDVRSLYGNYHKQLNDVVKVYTVEYKEEALTPKKKTTFHEKMGDILKGKIDYKNNKGHVITQYLYRGVRVENDLYINAGRVLDAKRRLDEPTKVELGFGGINLNEYGMPPRGVVWKMIDIQDMYDIIHFHMRNIIHNSGVSGTYVNLAAIPQEWGSSFEERLLKYMAYQKQGFAAVNPTQKGADKFNNYGQFNNNIDGRAIQAIQAVLKMLEYDADMISGVNAPMRGQIEQKEAVHNVKVGIRQVSFVTKEYFHYTDIISEQFLMSFMELVKDAFPMGISFEYNEGLKQTAIQVLPKYYKATNYVVSVRSVSEEYDKLQKLQAMAGEFAASGLIDPEVILEIQAETTVQGTLMKLKRNIKDNKARNKIIEKLNKQVEESSKQAEESTKALEEAQQNIAKMKKQLTDIDFKAKDLALKNQQIKGDNELERERLDMDKKAEENNHAAIMERTKLEREQLYLGTGPEREIKNL